MTRGSINLPGLPFPAFPTTVRFPESSVPKAGSLEAMRSRYKRPEPGCPSVQTRQNPESLSFIITLQDLGSLPGIRS